MPVSLFKLIQSTTSENIYFRFNIILLLNPGFEVVPYLYFFLFYRMLHYLQ